LVRRNISPSFELGKC